MFNLLRPFILICLFKQGPQDLPNSSLLMIISVLFYTLTSLVVSLLNQPLGTALLTAALDTILLYLLAVIALVIVKKPERKNQTITALAACGTILGFLYWPTAALTFPGGIDSGSTNPIAGMILLTLGLWNVVIIGHILRHALAVSFMTGIGVALLYMFITLRIINAIVFTTAG